MKISQTKSATESSTTVSPSCLRPTRDFVIEYVLVPLIAIAVCGVLLSKTLSVGFLLDDFYHVDYLHKALQGNWTVLLEKLHSNWSGDADSMTSYRPLLTVAFLIVFALFREAVLGFHVANILLLSACGMCIFRLTSVFVSRVCGRSSRVTAMCAMLLFLCYPLHIESFVTATNGGDLLAGFFYLLSLLTYCEYKSNGRVTSIVISLCSAACALLTKEIAVTLPAVISISSCVIPRMPARESNKNPGSKAQPGASIEIFFWLVLVGYAVVRTLALRTMVGGYGGFGTRTFLRQLHGFFDLATIQKIFIPLNEHWQVPGVVVTGLIVLYALMAARGIFVLSDKRQRTIAAFLLLWLVIGILPTFQIWHIYPNLLGSRLFFISSIPFCMLLSLLGTSDFSAAAGSNLGRLIGRLGKAAPFLLCIVWSWMLVSNLAPYAAANQQLENAKHALRQLAAGTPEATKIVLLTLPQDYCGAPMLGRAEFLRTFCRPPCMDIDISGKVLSVEQASPGAHEFVCKGPLLGILKRKSDCIFWIWSKESGCFVPWKRSAGAGRYETSLAAASPGDRSGVSTSIAAPSQVMFRAPIDTLSAAVAIVYRASGEAGNQTIAASCNVKFFWHGKMPSASGSDGALELRFVNPDVCNSEYALFDLQKYPEWTYSSQITDFGLELPSGSGVTNFSRLALVPSSSMKPDVKLGDPGHLPYGSDMPDVSVVHLSKGSPLVLSFSVEKIRDARGIRVEIPKSAACFPELLFSCPGGNKVVKILMARAGQVVLPEQELRTWSPALVDKVGQLRVVAIGKLNQPLGLPSEPLSFAFDRR